MCDEHCRVSIDRCGFRVHLSTSGNDLDGHYMTHRSEPGDSVTHNGELNVASRTHHDDQKVLEIGCDAFVLIGWFSNQHRPYEVFPTLNGKAHGLFRCSF